MLISDSKDYQIGDFVLFDGEGPTFTVLSLLLGHFDKDWRKLKRKPWHVGFLSKKTKFFATENRYIEEWWISEAKGNVGITENRLNLFKEPYFVFRWFDNSPDEIKVKEFIDAYRGEKYDNFLGYFFVILWYFWKRWPFVIDYKWMCWEWLWFFALSFGKPIDNVHKYPLITILMDKIKYPEYE